jgi:hypothetical protein
MSDDVNYCDNMLQRVAIFLPFFQGGRTHFLFYFRLFPHHTTYSCKGLRGQFFKQIFAPTEKFAPTQYSAYAIVRAYPCCRREFTPKQVLKKLASDF